jgi:uncharacterized protein RhaS with RHS repeats
LYYYRSRFYDPQMGRFISEDALAFGGGINFYAYVLDSPVNFADPFGTQPCNKQKLIEAQDAAMNNPDFQADPSGYPTHCNAATQSIMEAMGAPVIPGNANAVAQGLADPAKGYQPINPDQAQAIANAGGLAIGAWTNPNPNASGHVVTVRPEGVPGDSPVGAKGPILNNIGTIKGTGIVRQSKAFRSTMEVLYYTLAGRKDCD